MFEAAVVLAVVVALVALVRAQDAALDASRLRKRLDDLEARLERVGGDSASAAPPAAVPPLAPPTTSPSPEEPRPASASPDSIEAPGPFPEATVAPVAVPPPPLPTKPADTDWPVRPLAPLPASLRRSDAPEKPAWNDDDPLPVVGRERTASPSPSPAPAGMHAASVGGDTAGFEARFGSTWLLRIGLVLLAIAAALFSLVLTPRLGPAGKVALGYGFAGVLFALGLLSGRMRAFAQPVMAGALSIGFFVSYAAYFIEPMRCMPVALSLACMGGFVAAILVGADRWRSEFTAGLAIFLGHVAAFVAARNLETGSAASLVAVVALSLCAVVLLLRRTWMVLSLFAVVAAYLSHLFWTSLADEVGSPQRLLAINIAFLSSYYFIFAASDLMWWRLHGGRRAAPPSDEAAPDTPATAAGASGRPALGDALGPLNLVFYTALVSWMYLRTGVELDRIHYFFFGIAAVQAILGYGHRAEGNPDTVFYPASAVVLLTLGFFSAFETLALNLVLAAEAMVLLVVAHQTRLRMFHLLSQAALLANFVHYWFIAPDLDPTRGHFIGGILTASVYFVKSGLEEIWYGPGTVFSWRERRPLNAILRELSDAFGRVYSLITPLLAHFHSAAGALILIDQCRDYLLPFDAALVLALGCVAFALLGSWRRSVPILIAAAFMYGGVIHIEGITNLHAANFYSQEAVSAGGRAVLGALGASAAALGFAMLGVRATVDRFSFALYFWLAAVLGLVLTAFARLPWGLPEGAFVITVGLAAMMLGLVAVERFSASWRGRREVTYSMRPVFVVLEILPGLVIAGNIFALLRWRFESQPMGYVMLSGLASALPLVALVRRSAGVYGTGVALMLLLTLGLADRPFARESLFASLAAAAATIAPMLVAAWAQDFTLERPEIHVKPGFRNWARLFITIPYASGMIVLAWLLQDRVGYPWFHASLGAAALALMLGTIPAGLRVGPRVAQAVLALASIVFALRFLGREQEGGAFLLATGVLILCALAIERVGRFFSRSREASDEAAATLDRVVEWILVLSPTLVAMTGSYASTLIGARWSTPAWSIYAAIIMALGFAYRSAPFRRTALGLLAICLFRVFLVDIRDLERIYQAIALLVLGLSLVAIAWLYSRFSSQMRKWL